MNKKDVLTRSLPAAIIAMLLLSPAVRADFQQALRDGQAGRFDDARKFLREQTARLEQELKETDVLVAGRNCAAIGFNSMLIRIASDCVDGTLSPQFGKVLFEAAQKAGSGQLANASSLAQQVTSAQPSYAPGYLIQGRIFMGRCLQENVDCERAIAAFRKSLELNAGLTAAHLDLAMLYSNRNDSTSAMAEYIAACAEKADPAVAKWAHFMLALLYSEKEQWAEAKRHALQAKSMGLANSGELLSEIERHAPSDDMSSHSTANMASMTMKELYDAALEFGLTGDFGTAKDYLTKAKAKDPSNMPVAIALSIAEEAAAARLPAEAGTSVFRSVQAGNAGNWEESLAQANKACELTPNSAPLLVHLGTVYVGLIQANRGDHYAEPAITAYRKAIAFDPNLGIAYYNLGVALGATRQWAEARDNLLKARGLGIPVAADLLRQIESRIPESQQERGATPQSTEQGGHGNFITGLFGPLVFVVSAPKILFSTIPEGSSLVDRLFAQTWGRGSTSYRVGFVCGAFILMSLLGGAGGAATSRKTSSDTKR